MRKRGNCRSGGEAGAALLLAILFTLIINGIALTLFATSSSEMASSSSQVIGQDSFNVAEAGINIGLLRVKALMEAHDPVDPSTPFSRPPFNLSSEGAVGDDNLALSEYSYFDLVTLEPLPESSLTQIRYGLVDDVTNTYTSSIDGYFTPESSNPDEISAYLTGAEPTYLALIDMDGSAVQRAWRLYLVNDNDHDDKTALLVSVGYVMDVRNNVLYQKRIEASVYIHGQDLGRQPDPSGQISSSARGARTGRFRVSSDLDQPVDSFDIR